MKDLFQGDSKEEEEEEDGDRRDGVTDRKDSKK